LYETFSFLLAKTIPLNNRQH